MNNTVRLGELQLLARGGQSDIYAFGEGRVLRVARRPRDYDRIDLLEAEGAPSISMERISGRTLTERIARNPLAAKASARELARLHAGILAISATAPIVDSKGMSRFCVTSSTLLTDAQKAEVLGVLEHLPDGARLCHGDFHPGNIIRAQDGDFIIDWSAASRGDPHSDVAHTYLLLKNVPRVPGSGRLLHVIQKRIGAAIASTYLQSMCSEMAIDRALLSKWLLVKAAERTYYGLPSEKPRLLRFITECLGGSCEIESCWKRL